MSDYPELSVSEDEEPTVSDEEFVPNSQSELSEDFTEYSDNDK
jgi:hypothetical protein